MAGFTILGTTEPDFYRGSATGIPRNNSPWKESVAGEKIIQGVRGDLKSRIAATGYLYELLTTQDLNCAV